MFSHRFYNVTCIKSSFNRFFSNVFFNNKILNVESSDFNQIIGSAILSIGSCGEIQGDFDTRKKLSDRECYVITKSRFSKCSLLSNDAVGGGAIRIAGICNLLYIYYTSFFECCATSRAFHEGGAVYFCGMFFDIHSCYAEKCNSAWYGQFISAKPGNSPQTSSMLNCTSVNYCPEQSNQGSHYCCYLNKLICSMKFVNFSNNHLSGYGAAFAISFPFDISLSYINVLSNSGMNIMTFQKPPTGTDISKFNVINNTAKSPGIFMVKGQWKFYDFALINNIGPLIAPDWDPPGSASFTNCSLDKVYQTLNLVEFVSCRIEVLPRVFPAVC